MDHQDGFWVERPRRGDKAAFGLLVEKYTPGIRRLVAEKTGQLDDAYDLTQEVMLQAYLSLHRLREPVKFASWLYGIALNVIRMWARHNRSALDSWEALTAETQVGEDVHLNGVSVEEAVAAQEVRDIVLQAIESLSDVNRQVVQLHYLAGLSYGEIAYLLGIPAKTVKSRLHKARQQLKLHLEPILDLPPLPTTRLQKEITAMIEANVYEVYTREVTENEESKTQTVVVLKARDQERYLPIWVGAEQGTNIATGLRSIQTPRPMTFDLMAQLVEKLGGHIEAVHLNDLREQTFYALLRIAKNGSTEEIDCRPSDALALALRVNAPIYINPDVLAQAGRDEAEMQLETAKPLELQEET